MPQQRMGVPQPAQFSLTLSTVEQAYRQRGQLTDRYAMAAFRSRSCRCGFKASRGAATATSRGTGHVSNQYQHTDQACQSREEIP